MVQAEPSDTSSPPSTSVSGADERAQAVALFNATWDLMAQPDRLPADADRMLHMAHASRHHWEQVGTTANLVRGEWRCSRDSGERDRWLAAGRAAADEVADPEDRRQVLADLYSVPSPDRPT